MRDYLVTVFEYNFIFSRRKKIQEIHLITKIVLCFLFLRIENMMFFRKRLFVIFYCFYLFFEGCFFFLKKKNYTNMWND